MVKLPLASVTAVRGTAPFRIFPVLSTLVGSGVARTTDAGLHWQPVYQHVRDAWLADRFGAGWAGIPYGIGVAPNAPDIAYATDSGRVERTTDGGKTWNPAYSKRTPDGNWTTNGIDVTTCYGVHFDPFDARHMFISYTDIGLWASDTGGASWYSATRKGVPGEWENTTYWMAFDPKVRGRIWAVMSGTHDLPRPKMWRRNSPESYTGGVTRSDDGGRTWRAMNKGIPQTAATRKRRVSMPHQVIDLLIAPYTSCLMLGISV
mgnify:CR=1 FL=1